MLYRQANPTLFDLLRRVYRKGTPGRWSMWCSGCVNPKMKPLMLHLLHLTSWIGKHASIRNRIQPETEIRREHLWAAREGTLSCGSSLVESPA